MQGVQAHGSVSIVCIACMQDLAPELRHSPVLVSGRGRSLQVAHEYGFDRAVSPAQLAAAFGANSAPFSHVGSPESVAGQTGVPCPVQVCPCTVERFCTVRVKLMVQDDHLRHHVVQSTCLQLSQSLAQQLPCRLLRDESCPDCSAVHVKVYWRSDSATQTQPILYNMLHIAHLCISA